MFENFLPSEKRDIAVRSVFVWIRLLKAGHVNPLYLISGPSIMYNDGIRPFAP